MNSNIPSASEIQFPSGFRFAPTEHELIQYYLIPKLTGKKLPLASIMDLDVFKMDPEQLPLNHFERTKENEAYFFTESSRENGSTRATPSGYWETYKENVAIFEGSNIIGFKNKFLFYTGRYPHGDGTNWKMVEYRCIPSVTPTHNKNWLVCKVCNKINVDEEAVEEVADHGSSGQENN